MKRKIPFLFAIFAILAPLFVAGTALAQKSSYRNYGDVKVRNLLVTGTTTCDGCTVVYITPTPTPTPTPIATATPTATATATPTATSTP